RSDWRRDRHAAVVANGNVPQSGPFRSLFENGNDLSAVKRLPLAASECARPSGPSNPNLTEPCIECEYEPSARNQFLESTVDDFFGGELSDLVFKICGRGAGERRRGLQ